MDETIEFRMDIQLAIAKAMINSLLIGENDHVIADYFEQRIEHRCRNVRELYLDTLN